MKVASQRSLSSPVWWLQWAVSFLVMTLVSQVINRTPFNYLVVVANIADESRLCLEVLMIGLFCTTLQVV